MRTEQEIREKYNEMNNPMLLVAMDVRDWEIIVNLLGWVLDIPKEKRFGLRLLKD